MNDGLLEKIYKDFFETFGDLYSQSQYDNKGNSSMKPYPRNEYIKLWLKKVLNEVDKLLEDGLCVFCEVRISGDYTICESCMNMIKNS